MGGLRAETGTSRSCQAKVSQKTRTKKESNKIDIDCFLRDSTARKGNASAVDAGLRFCRLPLNFRLVASACWCV